MVRDRIDTNGMDMDNYERVDLTLAYQVTEQFRPYLRVENLFDEDYEEVSGFTTPGLFVVAGIDLNW